ncbi:tyrosine-type recombinase/integrase [Pseudoalteromonas sp. NZS71_1]|uniref:tyrosine-type recombinase/integrase n=1 Tax=Pseudoalteromonas sp. NZS71_1 TaxID=2792072 RepID=UPI0018CCBBD1|nr:site-specific integrase [Pseudoalteromonas sp. NZS71_1]MBH0036849.1 tyrosine-type recombinase/integrase [Pseudoalteromonas sp. NZS71_1]
MNVKEIKANIKSCKTLRFSISDGLYIKPNKNKKSGAWELRYTINGSRRFMTLEGSNFPEMTLTDAKALANNIKQQIKNGIDPLAERARRNEEHIITITDLFDDWYKGVSHKLKHPHIQLRYFNNEIKPQIGRLKITDVNARDIRSILQKAVSEGRPSIANKALLQCKQLFKHAQKLDLTTSNPAIAFNESDAGGSGQSRTRCLTLEELKSTFSTFRKHSDIFTRDNYIAVILLLALGIRKGELIASKWDEFNFDGLLWQMPKERSKTGVAITIPIPTELLSYFEELKVRACGSDYLFPARRASKRRAYISDDTLNHALAKMFGMKVDSNKKPYPNLLGEANVEYFVIHDLRRTCRSLLAELGIGNDIAERCLNHKIKGVAGVYNRYDYLEERRSALSTLADLVIPLTNDH